MGVPKFYRWISERYPCLSEVVKEYQIPEFDNLYLDMNGVVHVCSHPEDDNPHFRITEEKIFADIFHYIEVLFRMIKPKKVFFMAIDGVAPRAKMNQQRGRRFRSAREAEDLVRKALEKGEILPKEQRFDSNCITPGTEFMVKLQEQLKYFVVRKISEDRMWQGVRVYLSGHETPGEGEHKIMDFIRQEKSKPDYDANTRHCLYGLDADLMMLGLSTHEPHFSLLREEVRFGSKQAQKRSTAPEETTFHLLHLSLMREYLDFEFSPVKDKLPFGYDFEKILDDWVLMGFLVGNDFIPHLPHLHIHTDALPTLWNTYMEVLPTLDGYINESGHLNLPRFEKYMKKLSQMDKDRFNDTYADLKWMESKLGGKPINEAAGRQASRSRARNQQKQRRQGGLPTSNAFSVLDGIEDDEFDEEKAENEKELVSLEASENADVEEELEEEELTSADEEEDDLFSAEFQMHKNHYYMDKLAYEQVTPEVLRDQAEGYVKAIQWILAYYFNGVPSWSWFYPHHYAPYMSDVKDFSNMKIELDLGTPFLPFQQLMAVLPAASKSLLPKPYQKLMTMEDSPVIDFYPVQFETDLNGKQQDWEAVVLIPFIEEERLLSAMKSVEDETTPEEKARNRHGPCLLYQYSAEDQGVYSSILPTFPDITHNHAKLTKIPIDAFHVEPAKLQKGLCEGAKLDVYFPGFPTLKHIKHRAELRMEGVKVFQMNSRGQNMMLIIDNHSQPDIEQLGQELLGRSLYTSWPHLSEALVVSVANDQVRYSLVERERGRGRPHSGSQERDIQVEKMSEQAVTLWHREVASLKDRYHDRQGVEVGDTYILLHAKPMVGRKYICGAHGKITLEKQWAVREVPFLYQACVKDIAVHDASFKQYRSLDELFPVKSEVFMLGSPNYGCMGEVLDLEGKSEGRIRVAFTVLQEPNFENIIKRQDQLSTQYMPGYVAAQRCGISGHLLSRMTGTIFVTRGTKNSNAKTTSRFNIGLNLKFNKKNEQVPGWTRRTEDGWMYSTKLVQTMGEYIQKFPELFEYVGVHTNEDQYYEEDIFGEDSGPVVQDLVNYLKNLPCAGVTPMSANAEILDQLLVREIEKEVDKVKELNRKKKKHVKMQVRPHLLYRPLDAQGVLVPDPTAVYCLFDRVVNIRMGYSVPLGMRGTVIGIHHAEKEQEIIYEVVFDEVFLGGMCIRCSASRGYRMPPCALVNLSHGERKTQPQGGATHKPTAVVKPQTPYQPKYAGSYQDSQRTGTSYQEPQRQGAYSQLLNKTSAPQQRPQQRGNYPQQPFFNPSPQVPAGGVSASMPSGAICGPAFTRGAQFVTPKMASRHIDHRSDENRNKNQSARRPEQEREFADIWQQLQSSGDVSSKPASSAESRSQSDQTGVPSLQEAAKALQQSPLAARDKTGVPSGDRTEQEPRVLGQKRQVDKSVIYKSDSDTGGMQRVDVTALFDQSKQSQASIDSSVVGVMSAQSISQELAGLFQSLETADAESASASGQKIAPQGQQKDLDEQQRKEGTATLCNMLKIGGSQASNAVATSQPSPSKNYGRQLSVQELFEGAQQSPAGHHPAQHQPRPQPQGQVQQTHVQPSRKRPQPQGQAQGYPPQGAQYPPPPSQQPQGQAQRGEGRRGDLVQSTQPKRGAVAELQQWCHKGNLKAPRLDYQNIPGRGVSVCITLSNGARFQGSISRTPDQAAESAAAMALYSLKESPVFSGQFAQGRGQGVQTPPRGPHAGMFCSSPNSAFTPVRPGQPGDGSIRGQSRGQPIMGHPVPNPQFCHPLGFPNPPVHHGQPHQQAFLHTRQMPQRHPLPQPQRYPPQDTRRQHHPGHNPQGYGGHMGPEAAIRQDSYPTSDTGGNHPRTPRKDNPFVPLQVTVQQKTPNRNKGERSSQSHVATVASKPDSSPRPSTGLPANQKQDTPTSKKPAKTKQDSKVGEMGQKGQGEERRGPGGSQRPPRKGRSRLAANFSGGK